MSCLRALLLGLPVLLTACGGGGSSNTQATAPLPTPTAEGNPSAAATSSAATSSGGDASCGLNTPGGIQTEMLQRVNDFRASGAGCGTGPLPPAAALVWNTTLLEAAKGHATDMASNNYFSHTGRDGRTPAQRVLAAGYSYSRMGENIAAGQVSVQSVVADWIASPSHCQNMLTSDFRDVAVACIRNDAATYRLYWVMELGRPR